MGIPVYHGGAFFDAVGDEFDRLSSKDDVISADVLDAWFDPAPAVLDALREHLPWALRTSPPTSCDGMQRVVARTRGVDPANILPGAGSSDLIFLALRHWVHRDSRVLILDPMYGEYAHVLEQVIGCRVDRLALDRACRYDVDPAALSARIAAGYDWVILVNPNSPTGRHMPREQLAAVLSIAPRATRFWIDETYVDYAGSDQSLERFAAASRNVVVAKSMSKVYALSGVRCAYLCGPTAMIDELRGISPPWAVSLPAQIAACEALRHEPYYRQRWTQTHHLRDQLAVQLRAIGLDVIPGCANFLLCHLPDDGPDAAAIVAACRRRNVFLRDVGNMGTALGSHAIRVAVKDVAANFRIVETLRDACASAALARSTFERALEAAAGF